MREFLPRDEFEARFLKPFQTARYVYTPDGWIVWRRGTGDNCELLHIRAFEPRRGHGRRLVRAMLDELEHDRRHPLPGEPPFPYHTVYGFTRVENEGARAFYAALGFVVQVVDGVYADGRAVLFSGEYLRLLGAV